MKQKTIFLIIALYVLLLGLSPAMLWSQSPLKDKIIAKGDWAFPPFEFINEKGEPDGFNVELFKALMLELNLDYDLKLIHWADAYRLLKDNEIDLITGMAYSASRATMFNFSTPHSYFYQNVVCRKGSQINSLNDIDGKEIILQDKEISQDIMARMVDTSNIVLVDNMYDGLRLLAKGKHNAAVCCDIIAKSIIKKYHLNNLEIKSLAAMPPLNNCIATNINNKELHMLLNNGLTQLKAKGIYDKIYNKWFISYDKPIISKYIYIIIGILALIVIVSFTVIYIIRKHIYNVTRKLNITNAELTESLLKMQLAIKTSNIVQWDYDCVSELFKAIDNPLIGNSIYNKVDNYYKIIHPDDLEKAKSVFEKMQLRQDIEFNLDTRMLHLEKAEKEWYYMGITGAPIKDKAGKVIKYTGFLRNNTKFVKLNEQLKETNLHLGMALRAGDITAAILDPQTDTVRILNTQTETAIANLSDIISKVHPDDRDSVEKMFTELKLGTITRARKQICYNLLDDKYDCYFDINYVGINFDETGKPAKIVGYSQNITKRKIAEMRLLKQKELMSTILNLIPIPIHIKDIMNDGKYIYWNNESEKMFGKGLSKSIFEIVDMDTALDINKTDKEAFDSSVQYIGHEHLKTIDGREYEIMVHKNVIYDGDKKLLLVIRLDVGYLNELHRKSKILSSSMNALNAFTWYCDLRDGSFKFGDGFEQTGGSMLEMNTIHSFSQRIHPLYRQKFIDFMNNFSNQNSGDFVLEYEVDLANNGNYEWWESRGTIETSSINNTPYKYIFGLDININTLKKNELAILKSKNELDNLNKQNELILNNTNSGLVFLDNNYVVQWENLSTFFPNLPLIKNYKKGCICYNAVKGLDAPCPNCIVLKSCISTKMEMRELALENSVLKITATPVSDKNAQRIGTVLKFVDITENKKINMELEAAKNKAEQSNKLKSAFLANMSHEIRTPLNAIVGFSQLLEYCEDEIEKKEYSNIINTNNNLLLQLIGDILDLSKIEAGMIGLHIEKFNVSELFDNISATLTHRITSSDVKLICTTPYKSCIVELDRSRFTQVITNFATNAIKFTPKGEIKIGYEYINGGVKIYVSDTGIGIAPNKIDKVFERFEKLDDFAQGTGLGMAICKAILDACGGTIGVDSIKGKGSTFWAWFPAEAIIIDEEQ
ncbi:MAG: transporter substrate-binding domain-containing protein [Bacteroidales bacterium]